MHSIAMLVDGCPGKRTGDMRRRSRRFGEGGLQLADDVVPQLAGQVMSHAVEQHESGTLDGPCDRAAAERPHQPVGLSVDHNGWDIDLLVVSQQASTAEDRGEVSAHTGGVVRPVVALDGLGANAVFGRRIAGTAGDSRYPDRVFDDPFPRRVLGLLQNCQQLSDARWWQQWLIVAREDD